MGIPPGAVRSRSGATSSLAGPLGLLGTGVGRSPLNKLNRTGGAREMLSLFTCVQTCPIAGREEQERILQGEEAPVPTCTPIYFNPIKRAAIIERSPGYRKPSSSVSPPPAWPFGVSFCFSNHRGNDQSNGDFLPLPYFCLRAPSWWVSLCPMGAGTSLLPEQGLCCPGVAGSLKQEKLVLCNT